MRFCIKQRCSPLGCGLRVALGLAWVLHIAPVLAAENPVADGYVGPPGRLRIVEAQVGSVPSDLKALLRFPVEHWSETRMGLLAVGGLILLDKPLTTAWQDHVQTTLDGFRLPRSPLNALGVHNIGVEDGWLLTGIGATYLVGVFTDDPKAQETGILAVKAAAYSVLVSQLVLKSLIGRGRPVDSLSTQVSGGGMTTNPFDFGHVHAPHLGSGGTSSALPSYHCTLFFSVATVYSRAHDDALWPYGLAAIGLASNIRGHHHWVSDMTAGALIGTAIGRVVTRNHVDGQGKWAVSPYVDADSRGLQLSYRF